MCSPLQTHATYASAVYAHQRNYGKPAGVSSGKSNIAEQIKGNELTFCQTAAQCFFYYRFFFISLLYTLRYKKLPYLCVALYSQADTEKLLPCPEAEFMHTHFVEVS